MINPQDQNAFSNRSNTDFNQNNMSGRGRVADQSDSSDMTSKPLTEKLIRKIIKDELRQNVNSGTPIVPRHTHDGNNSPRINQINIAPNTVYSGSIDMSQGTITGTAPDQVISWANYIIPTPSVVRTIKFYGGALNTTATPKLHAMIVGECNIGIGYQYQPGTSNSVIIGTVKENITQGSSAIIMTDGAPVAGIAPVLANYAPATSILRNSQSYIAFASDASNNIYAVARVYSFDNSQIVIQTAFASNWSLSGEWIIN